MIAICTIRDLPPYRKQAFVEGLRKVGYKIVTAGNPQGPEDLFISWNKYAQNEQMADSWERAGGTAVIVENGYAGRDADGRQYYAIAAHGHNGSGWWPEGSDDRWAALGIPLQPWREPTPDGHILVCGQRGIGSREMASPNAWHDHVSARLRKITDRPIRIRPHPGNQPAKVPLEDDLRGAHACVIWSSGSGVKALIAGVPVFYDAPAWICAGTAKRIQGEHLEWSIVTDEWPRLVALRGMAWAQWSVDEITSGEPFVRLRDEAIRRAGAKVAA